MEREVLLAYPDFSKTFEIHTDASATQLGAVISQEGNPIAFYSRKLNPAQTRYTTTERELLAIVETLKEFKNILLGQSIRVYTDHKNLTYDSFNTDRVMRWRLILEEYGPELIYVKGQNNIVADALSRLDLKKESILESTQSTMNMAEIFGLDSSDHDDTALPIQFKNILLHQQKDKKLLKEFTHSKCKYTIKTFQGANSQIKLICLGDKIVVPATLQEKLVQWYHTHLCHPGEKRTELTIAQHFYWLNLRDTVKKICGECQICQLTKRHQKIWKTST